MSLTHVPMGGKTMVLRGEDPTLRAWASTCNPSQDDLVFQVMDWMGQDERIAIEDDLSAEEDSADESSEEGGRADSDSDSEQEDSSRYTSHVYKYCIKAFGLTQEGRPVAVNILGYQPSFYLQFPDHVRIGSMQCRDLQKWIRSKLEPYQRSSLGKVVHVRRKDYWGFTNREEKTFVEVVCHTKNCMRACSNLFPPSRSLYLPGVAQTKVKVRLYESNLEPHLRFMHVKNLQPVGWIRLPAKQWSKDTQVLPLKVGLNVRTAWDQVQPVEKTSYAPALIASFDIECTSSHGDFPMPQKSYSKTAMELIEMVTVLREEKKMPADSIRAEVLDGLLAAFEIHPTFSRKHPHRWISHVIPKPMVSPNGGEQGPEEARETYQTLVYRHADDIYHTACNNVRYEKARGWDVDIRVEVTRNDMVDRLASCLRARLPDLEGDPVIQIGTTVHRYGESECCWRHILTLGTCKAIPGVVVEQCKSERQLLLAWSKMIQRLDPDIMTGYNILGFDWEYLVKRSREVGCYKRFMDMGRIAGRVETDIQANRLYVEKKLASSALGDNTLKFVDMAGRVQIDMMKVIQRDHKLDYYKLDHVAGVFIRGKVLEKDQVGARLRLDTTTGLSVGNFVTLAGKDGVSIVEADSDITEKFELTQVDRATGWITLDRPVPFQEVTSWGLAKDDVTPKDIFECQAGSALDRAKIAKYCVMDCALCNYLIMKLEILANNAGMSNVCTVPLSYIFLRGQGIKIFSLVAKECREAGFLLPTLVKSDIEESGYEGAIVLIPEPGVYMDHPVAVLDYSSLYPSSMISENISHDTLVLDPKYDNLPGVEYLDIHYDETIKVGETKVKKIVKTGNVIHCRYAQNQPGVLPCILQHLLKQRKNTRKRIPHQRVWLKSAADPARALEGVFSENESTGMMTLVTDDGTKHTFDQHDLVRREDRYNDFEKAVLDGLQLAYKVTANSLYGQVGARTSSIYMKELAASTTATGRNLILRAKDFIENEFGGETVYGDTDSVFVTFPKQLQEAGLMTSVEKIAKTIELAQQAEKAFQKYLKAPHTLEYEKTAYPFIIFSKKRYVYNKYENDPTKFKMCSMGIILKRRDTAQIVKKVFGGVIDWILNKHDVTGAVTFMREQLELLVDGKCDFEDLVLTKTLNATYSDPKRIAHKVLADRMFDRDPGSAPAVNERVRFIYVPPKNPKALQGDRIESPEFIKANGLRPDYRFYLETPIMNACLQFFELPGILEKLPEWEHYIPSRRAQTRKGMAKELLFKPYLDRLETMALLESGKQRTLEQMGFGVASVDATPKTGTSMTLRPRLTKSSTTGSKAVKSTSPTPGSRSKRQKSLLEWTTQG